MTNKTPIVNASGWRAVVKRWRRAARGRVNRLLTRWWGTATPRSRPLAAGTQRILVVRLNKRLGNIIFLTPMLRTLAAWLPEATIDVLVQQPQHRALLENLPGISRVWVQPRNPWAVLGLIRRLRAQRYDLAIDPSGNSTSNRIALALSGAAQRMGFASGDQWLRLTHAAGRTRSRHQGTQAIEMLIQAIACPAGEVLHSAAVVPGLAATKAAERYWQQVFEGARIRPPVIGFFIGATGGKQLERSWWQAWYDAVRQTLPAAILVQIRAPDDPQPLRPGLAHVAIGELDVLAAFMGRLDGFVAADSGPMHLAAAAGVPVIGLFKATDPAAYAPLGRDCLTLAGDDLSPRRAARAVGELPGLS